MVLSRSPDTVGIDMDDFGFSEPPRKRHKAQHEQKYVKVPDGYLLLASRVFRSVTVNDVQVQKRLIQSSSRYECVLLSSRIEEDELLLSVKSPGWAPFHLTISAQHIQDGDLSYLDDCYRCPSSLSGTSKRVTAAQHRAVLSFEDMRVTFSAQLLYRDDVKCPEKIDDRSCRILHKYAAPSPASETWVETTTNWDVKEFYNNVHVPPSDNCPSLRLPELQATLYPFQDRAVNWMLGKEKVGMDEDGALYRPLTTSTLPLDFKHSVSPGGTSFFYSAALGVASSSRKAMDEHYQHPSGGILAEAMGLGKTVEMIALISAHPLHKSPGDPTSTTSDKHVTKATLIITPPTILEQWKQEIAEHAPHLNVYHYTGIKSASRRSGDVLQILREQDIVLTTYNTLAQEIHYAQERPDRQLRHRPRRELPKSPLVQLQWWRCLLDEAQMVETGVSNAAIVARCIPRVHAWAVTGTPLKQSHRDLFGLLLFLKLKPWDSSIKTWHYLLSSHIQLFRNMISQVTLRHSKELIRDEIRIPPQSRFVVNLPFTAIEEQHYSQLHHEMQDECGLDAQGQPSAEDWDPDDPQTVEKMRSWLQRLRQTCLHPEIGERNRKALGKRNGGPLRTVNQVLTVMIEQIETTIHTERRNNLLSKLDQARLYEHARESQLAQSMLLQDLKLVDEFVDDCRAQVTAEEDDNNVAAAGSGSNKNSYNLTMKTEEGAEVDPSLSAARQRLRSALEIQHICKFFLGNTFYQEKEKLESAMPKPMDSTTRTSNVSPTDLQGSVRHKPQDDSPISPSQTRIGQLQQQESEFYDEAKAIRSELLSEVHKRATKFISSIRAKHVDGTLVSIPSLTFDVDDYGGIESRKIFTKLYQYCRAMNAQATQMMDIRQQMVDLVCRSLIDEDDSIDLTGDEYEDSTKLQDTLYVLMEIMGALFADRNYAITGLENLLVKQDSKQWARAAKEGEGPSPELMLKLLRERQKLQIMPVEDGSLRGILNEIRSLESALEWQDSTERTRSELAIMKPILQHVQKLQSEQSKSITALEQERNLFRDTVNARLDYYRALQKISDLVAPIGTDEDVGKPINEHWLARLQAGELISRGKLDSATSKRRYLLHLRSEQESEQEVRICTICQFEFEVGSLLTCGHVFCKECILLWWNEKRTCPVCKRRIHASDFYDVTYRPAQAALEEAVSTEENDQDQASSAQSPPSNNIYNTIPSGMLSELQSLELRGPSYGSKADTLVRHLIYLRQRDPGSKTVVFSQYRDFLDVLSKSFKTNNIVHSKFEDKDGIVDFKSNPANECFLLHAKAHAAGLNLVCASHVILCEPLINTAIELQAIARVHRIGQVRETFVWMYIIDGTVEEAIYDISVKRRLAHIGSNSHDNSRSMSRATSPNRLETRLEAANARELQKADISKAFSSKKTGGEMVDKEDLWQCLFSRSTRQEGKSAIARTLDLPASSNAVGAGGVIGRFLRAEAAQERLRAA